MALENFGLSRVLGHGVAKILLLDSTQPKSCSVKESSMVYECHWRCCTSM